MILSSPGKEIHLKHRAPVISITIVDRNASPLPGAFEVAHERAKAADMTGSHQVVICSEEQFKVSSSSHDLYKRFNIFTSVWFTIFIQFMYIFPVY